MDENQKKGWDQSWKEGFSPWHSSVPNQHLIAGFGKLMDGESPDNKNIVVPMCGKSVDLLWLYEQGMNVVGIELSEVPCKQFFEENCLTYTVEQPNPQYKMFVHNERFKIVQGDVLMTTSAIIFGEEKKKFDYIWDCHAMSALPYNMQKKYLDHMRTLLKDNGRGLVNSFEYDPSLMEGPPCAMTPEVMQRLFGQDYKYELIEKVLSKDIPNRPSCGQNEFAVVYLYQCI